MPSMDWNIEKKAWAKPCIACGRIFTSREETWDGAFKDIAKNFYEGSYRQGDGLQPRCKDCWNHYRNGRISNGLSTKQMIARQFGKCGIRGCPNEPTKVDHDHATGRVRKVICNDCNRRMSGVDDAKWLANAIAYRDQFRCE